MDWKEFLKMTNAYTRAYTEVLEILSHFSKEEYAKIPTKKIEFYRSNMDKKYNYKRTKTGLKAQSFSFALIEV